MKLRPQSARLEDYLAASEAAPSGDPAIVSQARTIVADRRGVEAITAVYHWVRDRVPHTADLGGGPITCTATEVLHAGTGICYAKSNLLAALLRCSGVPTGFCYQRLAKDPPYTGFELHALNAVYVDAWNDWVRIDARGNRPALPDGRPAVDAELTRDGTRLAFPVDPARGEVDDNRVFVEPLPETIKALRSSRDLETLWRALPSTLPL